MIELTDFQRTDEQWMLEHKRNMLLYDRGLGKTVVAVKRNIDLSIGTALVAAPKRAYHTWLDHTMKMWRDERPNIDIDVFLVQGDKFERKRVWDNLLEPERTHQHRMFVCTHQGFISDVNPQTLSKRHLNHIDQCDVDEAHRLRSRKSLLYKAFKAYTKFQEHFSFLSGTPISRGHQEFFTYLNCINPKLFSSYWRFVDTFCELYDGPFGKEIIGQRNNEEFYRMMNMWARIQSKEDPKIRAQMPAKFRIPLFTELTSTQKRLYKDLDTQKWSYNEDNGKLIVASGSLEQQIRLRQLLVCPKILDPTLTDMGGAFNDFLATLEDSADVDTCHTVLFTPFKAAFPHFRTTLESKGYRVSQLSGGISVDEQDLQIKKWQQDQGVMLCTIPFAESFHLPAKTAHFIGYEWDQNLNLQAEDRLHRWITQWPVSIYYWRYEHTIDDGMCNVINFKHGNVTSFYKGFHDYQQQQQQGAQ